LVSKLNIWKLLCCLCLFQANSLFAFNGFVKNEGQWEGAFLFQHLIPGGVVYLEKTGITWLFYDADSLHQIQHFPDRKSRLPVHIVKSEFLGSHTNPMVEASEPSAAQFHFFLGNDSRRWKSHLRAYQKVTYKDVYPHIDLEIISQASGIKYNFIVHPGGNSDNIQMQYRGMDKIKVDYGGLEIHTALGVMVEYPPYVFQEVNGNQEPVAADFILKDSILSFAIRGQVKKKHKMVIDPILVFSTYSGSRADNFGFTATYDQKGNGYAGGTVYSFDFPTSAGAYQVAYGGGVDERIRAPYSYPGRDCGIHKYNEDGSQLLYGTFIGGAHNEQPHSMIVNHKGELVILGSTRSKDFPTTTQHLNGTPQPSVFDYNIFVSILSEDGSKLSHSALIGGSGNDGINGDLVAFSIADLPLMNNYADDFRGEVIVDDEDHVYLASSTSSTNFPTANSFVSYSMPQNGVAMKLSPDLSRIIWSTHIGGIGFDAAYGLSEGVGNDLYITGGTTNGLMFIGLQGHRSTMENNLPDGWLLRVNKQTGDVLNGTLIGSSQYDQSYFVKTDKEGFPFVYGQSRGNLPVTPDVYSNAGGSQFIGKYSKDLKQRLILSRIGSGTPMPNLSPSAFLVDVCGKIYISGWGGVANGTTYGFTNGTTQQMPITEDALQKQTDGSDFYLAVFEEDMKGLLFATYFGGITAGSNRAHEHVDGGTSRFDKRGVIYQALCAGCGGNSLFPSTPNAWSTQNLNTSNCNFALFKIDMQMQNKPPVVADSFYKVRVRDRLFFQYTGRDPNPEDWISMTFTSDYFDRSDYLNKPLIRSQPGMDSVVATFDWTPDCGDVTGDTLLIKVKIEDAGCPNSDSGFALIRIVVEAPPLTGGPETLCISYPDMGVSMITWEGFPYDPYFKQLHLMRIDPDGSMRRLQTYSSHQPGSYRETSDVTRENYCYFMISENICGVLDTLPFISCSLRQLEGVVMKSEMIAVSVNHEQQVTGRFTRTKEEDFRSYRLLKKPNQPQASWALFKETFDITDITFVDASVKTAEESYCYCLQVTNKCGLISDSSDIGCNIVLSGKSWRWYFDLSYNPYLKWEGGVMEYVMERSVDTGVLRPILVLSKEATGCKDGDLDYDWGGYFYRVRAIQQEENVLGFRAESYSNTIYLIQPPLLHVPNAFSPNDDGLNDDWGFVPVFVREYHMKVFNRWGEKVFDSDDKKRKWWGEVSGSEPFDNVFVWMVTYKGWDNEFYTQKGTVTVIR
jgi:gliding motility-associated-like protein